MVDQESMKNVPFVNILVLSKFQVITIIQPEITTDYVFLRNIVPRLCAKYASNMQNMHLEVRPPSTPYPWSVQLHFCFLGPLPYEPVFFLCIP